MLGPISDYIFRDERDCWIDRRDEDPFEAGCQACEAYTILIEPGI
jgi:hypothetical protein